MKCDCGKEATHVLIDFAAYDALFTPLCDHHFEEVRVMEGELNIDYEWIPNLTLEDVVEKANRAIVLEHKRNRSLLEEYAALKKVAGGLVGEQITFMLKHY